MKVNQSEQQKVNHIIQPKSQQKSQPDSKGESQHDCQLTCRAESQPQKSTKQVKQIGQPDCTGEANMKVNHNVQLKVNQTSPPECKAESQHDSQRICQRKSMRKFKVVNEQKSTSKLHPASVNLSLLSALGLAQLGCLACPQ